jgi:glycosyltransferase involved in cell wall biosynthesis
MKNSDDQGRINDYLRREVFLEESYARCFELDPYTRVVYRRARELYWTLSRVAASFERLLRGRRARARSLMFPHTIRNPSEGPRIFIDATDLLRHGKATGIQRVVREISRHAIDMSFGIPITVANGEIVSACGEEKDFQRIEPKEGDILLLLDSGWNRLDDYPPLLENFRSRGGKIVMCIHDLFPLFYPALYTRGLVADFQVWVDQVVLNSDAVVAVSRSSAESFVAYLRMTERKPRAGMRLGWWCLGANFVAQSGEVASDAVRELAARAPYFLTVGTLEMRKGYPVALEAFERLWAAGVEANYVIVGQPGWNAAAFEERLRKHSQRGRRLFWLDDASDADLQLLYRQARAVVLPTFAEGFGLPLVEAAQYGAPVIASDIDVFREVGGPEVSYFKALDAESLADCVKEALVVERKAPQIPPLTWRESCETLMNMLRADGYQMTVG